MGEWRTLKAEREYRGCLLRAGADGAGYTWEVALAPGLRAGPAAGLHHDRPAWPFALYDGELRRLPNFADASALAVAVADAVCAGLAEWLATDRTVWSPDYSEVDTSPGWLERQAWKADAGGLDVRAKVDEYRRLTVHLGLGSRGEQLGLDGAYGAALSESVEVEADDDVPAAVDRLLRATAKAMGVAR